jgi:hypothetical protein
MRILYVAATCESFAGEHSDTFFHFEYNGIRFRIAPTGNRWCVEKKCEMRYLNVPNRNPRITYKSPLAAFKYLRMVFDTHYGYLNAK